MVIIIIVWLLFFRNKRKNTSGSSSKISNINAKWYSNYSPGSMYYFQEEYYTGKNLLTLPQNNTNPTIGIAFSGGGARAAQVQL